MLVMQYFCTCGGSPPSHFSWTVCGQTFVTQQSIRATKGGITSSPKFKKKKIRNGFKIVQLNPFYQIERELVKIANSYSVEKWPFYELVGKVFSITSL